MRKILDNFYCLLKQQQTHVCASPERRIPKFNAKNIIIMFCTILSLSHYLSKYILKLFHLLIQCSFHTLETQLGYHQQNEDVSFVSRAALRIMTQDLRKVGNFKKTTKLPVILGSQQLGTKNRNFDKFPLKYFFKETFNIKEIE